MPTYEYACRSCGQHLEVVQSFSDDALTTCPACGGNLRKVFGNIGISFKGTGFYKNDSRSSTRSGVPSASGDGGGAGAGSSADSGSSDAGSPAKDAPSTKEAPAPAKEAAKDTGGASRPAPTKPAAAAS